MKPKLEAEQRQGRSFARFAGAGFELAGISLVFGLVGYAIDRSMGNTRQLATAFAALIGFSLGLLRFIVLASKENARRPEREGRGE
ncbi:MAG: hypothetical protein ACO1RT_06390 [Planctomycetaceae bacterium]